MSVVYCVVACFCLIISGNEAAKILAVFPIPSISHQVVFRPLTQELAKRGHEVVVITTDPAFPKFGAPKNLTEIDVHDISYNIWIEKVMTASKGNKGDLARQMELMLESILLIVDAQLRDKQVQDMLKNKNIKFDLVLAEACVRSALIYPYIYKTPVIQISSFGAALDNYATIGAPVHPFLYPAVTRQRLNNLTLWEKITEFYKNYQIDSSYEKMKKLEYALLKKHVGEDMPSMDELNNIVDMLFLNVHPVFEGIRPVPPSVIFMGGLHQKPDKKLPTDLKSYLDSSKNGVIYISFGTNVDPALLPAQIIQTLVNTFSKLPYDVLWKWSKDELPGRTKNIRISKWLPQSDLLKHPKIKVFITQGGLQSTDEAITAGVPLIGMPMLGDQWYNVEKYEYHGIGINVDMETLTVEKFTNVINKIINDDSYRRNIIKLRGIMRDDPMKPLDRAVWWTEYVLRHGGAKHLRSPAANISWAEYLELEIVATLLAGVLAVAGIFILIIYSVYKLVVRNNVNDKVKRLQVNTHQLFTTGRIKMSLLLIIPIIYSLVLSPIDTAKILAVFPVPSISHQVVFRPLTQELARRGHDVTVVTPDPAFKKGGAPANLTEIDVHDISYKIWVENFMQASKGNKGDLSNQMEIILDTFAVVFDAQLQTKEVKEVINKNKQYDLLLLEACVRPALGISHLFKAPVILVSSFGAAPGNYDMVGASEHPLLYPTVVHQRIHNLNMWEKISELYGHYGMIKTYEKNAVTENSVLRKNFGPNTPGVEELSKNVDMLLLNSNPVFEGIRPVPPSVVYMGGLHQNPVKPLPEDLKKYLDSSKNGVIYVSFGTNVDSTLLPAERVQTLVRVFSKLPYDVLFKWDNENLPGRTDNIRISKWLPQSDLLRHPKVKLFITQGGLQSTDEAITAGVPLIGIPMLADQWFNVEKYVHHGIGIQLDLETLTEEQLTNAISTIVGGDKYRKNVIKLRELMTDQPMKPLERAVWWTEYVIRHGGAKHLRGPAANMSWSEYLELELVFTITFALLFALTIALASVFLLYKYYMANCTIESIKIKQK
ncbi:uncharacterized protein LOC142982985 [Anticarsia gemmatalis]|uniref:uncharacterized protein LOC142982985 n=1 Tax=Anticarsia gemmatalis TaxID=129554 RepID=UPI003F773D01